jgi:hypothetical protein
MNTSRVFLFPGIKTTWLAYDSGAGRSEQASEKKLLKLLRLHTIFMNNKFTSCLLFCLLLFLSSAATAPLPFINKKFLLSHSPPVWR